MVTFRFYVVSVVAFFLALAVGVVLGSALDGRISASLKDRLERVEANLDSTADLIDQKNDQIDDLRSYAEASVPFAVEGRLESTSTLIVAQSGVSADQMADVVAAVRDAGSLTPGIVWIDKSWDPNSAEFAGRVNSVLGDGARPAKGAEMEDLVWSAVLDALGAREAVGPAGTTTTSVATPPTDAVPPDTTAATTTTSTTILDPQSWWDDPLLSRLAQESVVSFQGIGRPVAGSAGSLNVVAVIGPDSALENDNSEIAALLRESTRRKLPTVLAEARSVSSGAQPDDTELKAIQESHGLVDVSTVQSADEPSGRVAVVVALQRAASGEFGNYGNGPFAGSLLPARPSVDGGS